jgi:D-alanyl-D-alanine carboxypeptidase
MLRHSAGWLSFVLMPVFVALAAMVLWSGPAGAADDLSDEIGRFLADQRQAHNLVGYSAVVLRDGERLHASTAGDANIEHRVAVEPDTVFQVFSVAKLFANVTVMQLVEAGEVELDAPISQYLSGLPEAWRSIPIRALMAHSSGLPEYYRWPEPTPPTAEAAIDAVRDSPFVFETGSATRYNQTNYLLLKALIEAVADEDFVSVMQSRMIAPAQLEHTVYAGEFAVVPGRATMYRAGPDGVLRNIFIDQPDYMAASTGLNSTAPDLARWFQALLAGGLVSEATLDQMWSPVELRDGRTANFAQGWEYAVVDGMTVFGHGGGNRADVRHFIQDGRSVTVVLLTNGGEADVWPGSISYGVARIVFASLGAD